MPRLPFHLKILLCSLVWAAGAQAHSGISLIHRYVEGGVNGGTSPWNTQFGDCAALLMNRVQEAFYFSDLRRVTIDPKAHIKSIDDRALDHMVVAQTLSAEQREFYRNTTDGTDLELSTYVETFVPIRESERTPGSVQFEGKWYKPASISRNVSAQKPLEMSADGRTVAKTQFVPLPWMREFPEYWEKQKKKFEGMFLFEEGRGAGLEKGAFKHNRAFNAYTMLREVLAFLPESEILASDAFLDRIILFGHTTMEANATRFTSPGYGYQALEPIAPGSQHAILYTTLRQRLEQYPILEAFPQLKEAMQESGQSSLYLFLKRYENAYTFRQTFLRSKKQSLVEIQDRSIAAFAQLYYWDPAQMRTAVQFYRMAKRDMDRGILPIENGLKKLMKTLPPLEFARRWVIPSRCLSGKNNCNEFDWLLAVLQSDDWAVRTLKSLFPTEADGVAEQLLKDVSTLILVPESIIRTSVWSGYRDRIIHQDGGKVILRLGSEDIRSLRRAFPASASHAQGDPLSLGIDDLKKRLMLPTLIPGLLLF